MIAAIAGFLARQQTAWPMAGGGAECTVVDRTPAAIVVQAPTVSIGLLEGAGTTLTKQAAQRDSQAALQERRTRKLSLPKRDRIAPSSLVYFVYFLRDQQ
jgi:hypothetical protein